MNATDIQRWLIRHLADHLAIPTDDIDPTAPLHTYGLDSAYALTLGADIADTFDVLVEPTLTWDHPTVEGVTRHLVDQLTHAPTNPSAASPAGQPRP